MYFAHPLNEMGKLDVMVAAAARGRLEKEPFVIKIVLPF